MKKKATKGKAKTARKRSVKDLSAKKAGRVKGGLLSTTSIVDKKIAYGDGSVRNLNTGISYIK